MDQTPKPQAEQRFILDLRDAIAQRTFFLVLGVLLIQCAFVFSYVGAFHKPTPHGIPIVVVNQSRPNPHAVAALNALPGSPVHAVGEHSTYAATQELRNGGTAGVLVIALSGPNSAGQNILYVASGGGAATVTALEQIADQAAAREHRQVLIRDLVPAQAGDARGLSGFYLVVGWLVGGYLAAALLAIAHGAQPATPRRAAIRLIAMAIYAFFSGLTGALVVGPVLGALTGHFFELWALGLLLVFCAAAVTMAFQVVAGILGIGITVLLFVVLGNPSAGGAYQTWLLPGFWRVISPLIPNGAGVQAVRHVVYFGAHGIAGNLAVILVYAALGTAVTLGATAMRGRRSGKEIALESQA